MGRGGGREPGRIEGGRWEKKGWEVGEERVGGGSSKKAGIIYSGETGNPLTVVTSWVMKCCQVSCQN